MRLVPLAALLAAALAAGATAGAARSAGSTPTGLHAFLLRADEPHRTSFPRTPSFAWNPVPGALRYQFQLSLGTAFRDNSVVYADPDATSPVEAPPLTLPWISGRPHSLYARVRAVLPTGATRWSEPFGFDIAPPPPPVPLRSFPGLLRWSTVPGADAYQVWLVDAHKMEVATTNVLDEREFYSFHRSPSWTRAVRWRVRALRDDASVKGRVNGLPVVQYGPWSPVYTSLNPTPANRPIKLIGTVSDVISNGRPGSPAHRLMPGFVFRGDETLSGATAGLFRIYVFTDRQCLNTVFTSAVVGSPAYAPRALGPLALPSSETGVQKASSSYLADGAEPTGLTADGQKVTATESEPEATPTTTVPGAPGSEQSSSATSDSSSSGSSSSGSPSSSGSASGGVPQLSWSGSFGAPTDLWDTAWPSSGYYWTVIPVAAQSPDFLATAVSGAGASAGDSTLPVSNARGFGIGDSLTVGSAGSQETVTVAGIADGKLTLASKLKYTHGAGESVVRSSGSLVYQDLELPQDVCAAGRVARFGKSSQPSLTSDGRQFATGLSSTGRLVSAVHSKAFYGQPLVSWQPALGAEAYEVQWSRTRYPFSPETAPGGAKGELTASTSLVLPVGPGTWWYRVRGFDYSLPTGSQQMSWSAPARLVVAKPTFRIVPRKHAARHAHGK